MSDGVKNMDKEAQSNKNTVSLCAVAVLILIKYAMVARISAGNEYALRTVIAVTASVTAFTALLFAYYKLSSGFSENCKYAAIMLLADPLILSNFFGVWQTVSLVIALIFLITLDRFRTKESLVTGIALFTAAAVVFNPSGVTGYASLILCSGLIFGAFGESEIIRNRKDVVTPVIICIVSAVLSAVAGGLVRKGFNYTSVYNYIPYERFDIQQIKSFFAFNRNFTELRTAVLACIPVSVACVCFINLLKKEKANSKNKDFAFKRKLVCASFCAVFISDVSGCLFFNSKASISLLVFSPVVPILIIKNGKNNAFKQTVTELEKKIASYPVLFTLAVIYTAAFFIPFCASNNIYKYITDFLV